MSETNRDTPRLAIGHFGFGRAGFADFVVSQPIIVTDARELLTMTTSWAPRRLRIAAEVLNACEHEAAIAALIAGVAPKMERGAVVKLGEVRRRRRCTRSYSKDRR